MAKQGKQKKEATRPGTPGGLSRMALRAPAKALAAILALRVGMRTSG